MCSDLFIPAETPEMSTSEHDRCALTTGGRVRGSTLHRTAEKADLPKKASLLDTDEEETQ